MLSGKGTELIEQKRNKISAIKVAANKQVP